jgi:hypothetical protein
MNLSDATVGQLLIPVDDFECGAVRLLVGVLPPGQKAQRGSAIYFQVKDIEAVHSTLSAAGVRFVAGPHVVNRTPNPSCGWPSSPTPMAISLPS